MDKQAFEDIERVDLVKESNRSQWTSKLLRMGVEERGIVPVPAELRTDTRYRNIFFVWYSMNFNILSFSAGTLGPVIWGLCLRDSCLVILFFNLLCTIPPAYFCTWGPKLGLRQMIQARYSFGYYGVIIPCIFNLLGMFGFSILNCILGGQALSSVADGELSWNVGIVIIAVVSLFISFCGYKVLTWYEHFAWIPVFITFLIAIGLGGKHFVNPPPSVPATARDILSFASTIAGFIVTYSSLSSDFTLYMRPDVSKKKIFIYSYLGFLLPIVTIQCFGAAVAVSAPTVPSWDAGYAEGNVGGVLAAMLAPVGGFGKFLMVILTLSVMGNIAATFYSICFNVQIFLPFLVVVPRYVFSVVATAIVIPLAIVGSHRFYETIVHFLGLIGYWASAFVAIILVEHFYFRRSNFAFYNIDHWDQPRELPWGVAAIATGICCFGVVVLFMDQVWFVGPAAKTTGDIGFEVAFAVAGILYAPFRALEVKLRGRL